LVAAADDAVLVVGLTGKYPPFNYFDNQGELVGFDVDFAKALCAPCVGSMAITEERSRAVRFSVPSYESGARLFVRPVLKTAYRAVPDGQRLAARSLGLSRFEAMRWVIAPQMLPICTGPALNTVVAMIKDSAVVSAIGVTELTLQTQQLVASTYRPLELYGLAAVLYFALTWPLLLLGRRLELRWREAGLLHG